MLKKICYTVIALLLLSCSKFYSLPRGVRNIETVHSLTDPNKIEVIEFMWLGCPHCKDFHPNWVRLKKEFGDRVNFLSHPAVFPGWEFDSRVFLSLEELGLIDDGLLANYYEARQSPDFPDFNRNINQVADWLQQRYGVPSEDFIAVFENIPLMEQREDEIRQLLKKYPIDGTPTIMISVPASGQTYLVTGSQVAALEANIRTLLQQNLEPDS